MHLCTKNQLNMHESFEKYALKNKDIFGQKMQ